MVTTGNKLRSKWRDVPFWGDDIFEGETLMIDERDLWQMFKLGWVIVDATGNKLRSTWRNVPARQGGR